MGLRLPHRRPLRLPGGQGAVIASLAPLRWPTVCGATAIALAAIAAAACGGGNGGDEESPAAGAPLVPIVVNSELVVGENRLMVGLLSAQNEEIVGADVAFRLYAVGSDAPDARELAAESVVYEKSYTHTHEDGTVESHSAGESGVYVANATFDSAGEWALEVDASLDGVTYEPASTTFDVLEAALSIATGAPAPLSETLTVDDVEDVADIDTSNPPIPGMHAMTIAEAVTSGKPSLVVFATPAFCLSRVCGPTKEVVDGLFDEYGDRLNFVHVEPYDVARARSGEGLFAVPAVFEWGLAGEPWVFIVDAEGNVAAKFEAIVTAEELTAAIEAALAA